MLWISLDSVFKTKKDLKLLSNLKTLGKAHFKRHRNLSEINLTYDKLNLAFYRQLNHKIKTINEMPIKVIVVKKLTSVALLCSILFSYRIESDFNCVFSYSESWSSGSSNAMENSCRSLYL